MKKILAIAIASAFAAPAFAATSNVDIYGVMNISIEDTNATNTELQVTDRQSRIGFKGTEDLGGGLKAIWQIESTISPSNQDGVGGGTLAGRNSFVGLSGGFGTVLMGRHDTPYKLATQGKLDIFADTIADTNGGSGIATTGKDGFTQLIEGSSGHDHRSPDAIAYVSPTFSGFTLSGAVISTNNVANLDSNDTVDAYSLSAAYENGPLYVALGYQDVEQLDSAAFKVGVGYKFGAAKIGFIYEDIDNAPTNAGNDRSSWVVNGAYAMGAITLKAQYGQVDRDLDSKQSKFSLGADYSLSKRTTAFAVYDSNTTKDNATGNLTGYALGVKHSF
jgi:predicted porin